jgi:hypothetical protein
MADVLSWSSRGRRWLNGLFPASHRGSAHQAYGPDQAEHFVPTQPLILIRELELLLLRF